MNDKQERAARTILRRFGLEVEAVAWIKRFDNEFAAIVVINGETNPDFRDAAARQYDRAMEVLTDPRCPFRVVREFAGQHDIRIYVAPQEG